MNARELEEWALKERRLPKTRALVEAARAWHVARQRFDASKHSADVEVLKLLWKAVADAEERLAVALEELDR